MGRKVKRRQSTADAQRNDNATELINTLIRDGADTSRLLELYYWTREPGIVEMIRAYLDMPERAQRNLSTFLLNGKPQSVSSSFDQQGRLVLGRIVSEQAASPSGQRHRQV
ncbi:hypothetical protein [Undibacter mobilis]|uniref:Uncharacterized protein n=1 Tax=Undibacter mobilis TaxID=2292256 RepID=A0A371B9W0_9BRAD|nr:hypothetical protein [Undibacter mobilis]RDV04399.1 hypothetical protein DXH78_07320 [Undibacter mobilis]